MKEPKTLQEAKSDYARTGECFHKEEFKQKSEPYGTNVVIINCGVCGYEHERFYKSKN